MALLNMSQNLIHLRHSSCWEHLQHFNLPSLAVRVIIHLITGKAIILKGEMLKKNRITGPFMGEMENDGRAELWEI